MKLKDTHYQILRLITELHKNVKLPHRLKSQPMAQNCLKPEFTSLVNEHWEKTELFDLQS